MKYRLQVFQPRVTENIYGEEENTFEEFRTIYAQRVKISNALRNEVGEHFSDYSIAFNIRDSHPIKEGWRVKQIGGYLYHVVGITPNLGRGMVTLHCERVNE